MIFEELAEYKKDLKNLLKKYRTLNEDLDLVKLILTKKPDERPPFSFRIDDLGIETCIIKVKKIACMSLKGRGVNSGFRLVYAYFPEEGLSSRQAGRIVFVELYFKGDKEGEDRERILGNFG
jgi:hypothetical protein